MIKKKAVNSELWGHRPNDLWTLAFLREGELPQSTTTIHSTNTTMLHPIPFQHRRRQVPTSRIFPLFHSLCLSHFNGIHRANTADGAGLFHPRRRSSLSARQKKSREVV
ncbi:hypothetical protein KQX54_002488 [Cotesia glomerata]|uniref:Uncharacterized protein n=1 Tax=Cotesia glomerata TaxID=32391 RepID=A0AAV7IW34_COTGL|nr:hypothetical protein KQX54_002488 [Cotesia glomerata]